VPDNINETSYSFAEFGKTIFDRFRQDGGRRREEVQLGRDNFSGAQILKAGRNFGVAGSDLESRIGPNGSPGVFQDPPVDVGVVPHERCPGQNGVRHCHDLLRSYLQYGA
jgi:hypothetical protein